MFTDSKDFIGNSLRTSHCYVVSPHVRVRKEEFGLLFYNTQSAKLTFVKSGELFQIHNLPRGGKMVAVSLDATDRIGLKRSLDNLVNKGLIFEA